MNQEQLEAKSLGDLREIAKLQGVKSVTKYRKSDLVRIIMNGGTVPAGDTPVEAQPAPTNEVEAPAKVFQPAPVPVQPEVDAAPQAPAEPRPITPPDTAAPRMRPAYTPRPQQN